MEWMDWLTGKGNNSGSGLSTLLTVGAGMYGAKKQNDLGKEQLRSSEAAQQQQNVYNNKMFGLAQQQAAQDQKNWQAEMDRQAKLDQWNMGQAKAAEQRRVANSQAMSGSLAAAFKAPGANRYLG
jgi:hypothetical protein